MFSADGQWLVGSVSSEVWIWEVSTWQVISKLRTDGKIWDMALSPDGRWLATAVESSSVPYQGEGQLWDATSGELVARMPHPGQALDVAFSDQGKWIAVGGGNGVRVWEMEVAYPE